MPTKNDTDISPAIQELKKLHGLLIDHIGQKIGKTQMHSAGAAAARDTVISILPGDRRKEDGWYKWRAWEKKSDEILHELDNDYKVRKYHEIFVAGEALSGTMQDIVLLMMHQVAHQAAAVQSLQSYHSEWMKIWLNRLFDIPYEAIERDEVLGWYRIDQSKLGAAQQLVDKLAAKLQPVKFDLFRLKLSKPSSTGKMYKWVCECKPAVRSGGILYAKCEKCDSVFKIDPKGVRPEFLARVPRERRGDGNDH